MQQAIRFKMICATSRNSTDRCGENVLDSLSLESRVYESLI